MREADFKELAKQLLYAREFTELDRRSCWTPNAATHVRLSHLIDLLQRHPSFDVVSGGGLAGGRIRIVDPSDGSVLLLKPRGAITHPWSVDESEQASLALDRGSDLPGDPLSQAVAQLRLPGLDWDVVLPGVAASQAHDGSRHGGEASEPEPVLVYDVIDDDNVVFAEGMSRRVRYLGGTVDRLVGYLTDVWDSREQSSPGSFDQAEGDDWTEYLQDPVEGLEQESG